jgi:hypothetical protein
MTRRFALIPVAAAALLATAAQAQVSGDGARPWYVGVNQAVSHESGVVAQGSDTNYTTTLRGGLDMRLGRGRGWVDGNLRHQRYSDHEVLNNNGWDVRGGLDWETVGNLSGSINGATSRRLSRFNSATDSGVVLRNLETLSDVEARARLGTNGPLAIEGGIGRRELFYSAPERDADEYRENRANLGVLWRPGGALTLGTGVAARKSDFPRFLEQTPGVFIADHSTRREIYVTAEYDTGGRSTVAARVNATRVRYDLNVGNNFSGLTGNVTWAWKPTGKLTFTSVLARDTGRETEFSTLQAPVATTSPTPTTGGTPSTPTTPTTPVGSTPPIVSSFQGVSTIARIVNTVSTRVDYEATAKISAVAGLSYSRQSGVNGRGTSENILTTTLGARWQPTRAIGVGCDVTAENRSVSEDARRFGCYGEFLIN